MKNFIYIVTISIICTGMSSCNKTSQPLYPITVGNKMGFIDSTGRTIIEPKFDYVDYFNDDLALVIVDSMYGYIDKRGKFKIPLKFNILTSIRTKQDTRGLIINGNEYYSTNQKPVRRSDSLISHINNKPDSLFDYGNIETLRFSESKAGYCIDRNIFGFINKSGLKAINSSYSDIISFSEGLAGVEVKDSTTGKTHWGYIDHAGEIIIKPEYTATYGFKDGIALATMLSMNFEYDSTINNTVRNVENKCFLINKSGHIILTTNERVTSISDFSHGYAVCHSYMQHEFFGNGFNYIDQNGNYLLDYEEGQGFLGARDAIRQSDGKIVFPVKINSQKWGLLPEDFDTNPQLDFETTFIYDDMGNFFEGLARVKVEDNLRGDKWGYIDTDNELVIKPQYSLAKRFRDGLAYVEQQTLGLKIVGYINKKGVMVWSRKMIGN